LYGALERIQSHIVEHSRAEEERALPLVEKYITAVEYGELEAKALPHIPPKDLPLLSGMLIYEGGLDVVPAPVRAAMREAAPKAYAEHSQRVHGTATPPRSTSIGLIKESA
jgi:hypothetical protein